MSVAALTPWIHEYIDDNTGHLRDGARPEVGPPRLSRDIEYDLPVDHGVHGVHHASAVQQLERERLILRDRRGLEGQRLRAANAVVGQDDHVRIGRRWISHRWCTCQERERDDGQECSNCAATS
jgi:hypothetical protein